MLVYLQCDVLVTTHGLLEYALSHAFLSFAQISVFVVDEGDCTLCLMFHTRLLNMDGVHQRPSIAVVSTKEDEITSADLVFSS